MSDVSWLGPAIDVRPLFAGQQAAFVVLLRRLDPDDWARPTVCPGWSVHDVAAHVLGDHLGRLARHRDDFHPPHSGAEEEPLPAFIDRINDEWVTATRRLSPRVIIDLLTTFGGQVTEFWQKIDMHVMGEGVSWAGADPAPVWLDAARDFSEYWTHHQQVAEAVGRPGPTEAEYLGPVLDTFLRALPHTLREVAVSAGSAVQVTVSGEAGGTWTATRGSERWGLGRDPVSGPDAEIEMDADTAWRLCTRGITPDEATERVQVAGDPELTKAALTLLSIAR